MAGIYIHIPFCKVKCSYCDFYKTTNNQNINELVKAIKLELWLRKDYLHNESIQTIYFGGGTPSLLSIPQIEELLLAFTTVFTVDKEVEITLEANPDDLHLNYLKGLKKAGINRLSIGIQSFSQTDLKFMKRRHNPVQAIHAVKYAKEAGFKNISVDLIYGVPGMSSEQWKKNLNTVVEFDVQHISAYHLTYHKGTQLWDQLQKGKIHEIEEKQSVEQFNELVATLIQNGFEHYEISNFCKDGLYSKHNSSYWNQTNYLGLGPSAHSYNKVSRQWNVASLSKYLAALKEHKLPFESENLSLIDRFNDYVITTLRTIWGLNINHIQNEFGEKYVSHVLSIAKKYIESQHLIMENDCVKLSSNGWFVSDGIMSDLMMEQ